jgi:hypothetical protein
MPNPMNFFNINPPLSNHVGTVCYTLKSLFPAPRADFRAHPPRPPGLPSPFARTIEQEIFAISQDRSARAT